MADLYDALSDREESSRPSPPHDEGPPASIRLSAQADVIVTWYDRHGPRQVIFGPTIPLSDRIAILTMGNDDWGWIWIRNPGSDPFLWCSASIDDRNATRLRTGHLVAPSFGNHGPDAEPLRPI
jgi:hypothetical protein